MAAKLGFGFGPEEKARAFAEYLEEIGLPVERVLGNLGPAEVGDVVSFFYAGHPASGMPDRFKDDGEDGTSDHDGSVMPAEHWCAAVWEAEGRPALTA